MTTTSNYVPTFGEKIDGIVYTYRPGAYGLIFQNQTGLLAIVQTPVGKFLPGGGSNSGEKATSTLRREAREKCGFVLRSVHPLGEAVDYFKAVPSGRYYKIHSQFFTAHLYRQNMSAGEADHVLSWLEPYQAAVQLYRPSQAWAVRYWIEINGQDWK